MHTSVIIRQSKTRKTFSHDINEIQRTVRRIYGDNIWDPEEEEESIDGEEEGEEEDEGDEQEFVDTGQVYDQE